MKSTLLLAAALLTCGLAQKSAASVLLLFNAPFERGMSSNLANHNGDVTNGMSYGIIVDSSGNGFRPSYDSLGTASPALNSTINLTVAGSATDDILFVAGDKTSDSSQGGALFEVDGMTPGGNGGVTSVGLIYSGSVNAGDKFLLFWIDNTNSNAGIQWVGLLSDPSFFLPADGAVSVYDAPFVGIDPVRSANNMFGLPEPSGALLGLLGAVGLIRRRRN